MLLPVGFFNYRVVVDPDIDSGLLGQIDHDAMRIRLSADVPVDERLTITLHEFGHAIYRHHPPPIGDEEAFCHWCESVVTAFVRAYERQGGARGLSMLGFGDGGRKHVTLEPVGHLGAHQCGNCGAPVAAGSIVREKAHHITSHDVLAVRRGFCCATCDRITIWHEQATPDGLPTGCYLTEPHIITGDEAAAFLAAHPMETGMRLVD